MNKLHLIGALSALALAHAPMAMAQTTGTATGTSPSDAPAASTSAKASTAAIPAGTPVVAADKTPIGTVIESGETQDGTKAVAISVDGKRVVVAEKTLKFVGKELVSSYTKAQLLATAE